MKQLLQSFREFEVPTKDELRQAINSFSKKWLIVFVVLFLVLFISTLVILEKINQTFMIEIPTQGGSLTEGVIEAPRFVNPVLALSETDKDLTALVYSGLMRRDSDGAFIKDLAESYEVSKDGLSYIFTLRDDIFFHDGEPVTAEDVLFTINRVKDPILKSSQKINWEGITIEEIDEHTIEFNLKQPYSSFLENATLGILPSHIWKDVPTTQFSFSDFNINAIGSGPYKIKKVKKRSSGILEYFELVSFRKFTLGNPFIDTIIIRFYPNEDGLIEAFVRGEIDQIKAISGEKAQELQNKAHQIRTVVLPRIFGLFFNQNQTTILTDKEIIKAFNLALDKKKIVEEVLQGFGIPIDSPIPKSIGRYKILEARETEEPSDAKALADKKDMEDTAEAGVSSPSLSTGQKEALEILEKAGWKRGDDGVMEKKDGQRLQFSIATGDVAELKRTVELIKEDLERIGASVELKIFEIGDLNQNVIRPRKYDALFFGQIISRESDLFAFWHSSQRNDPGLNIALYTNTKVDELLEEALTTLDEKERLKKYAQFEEEIKRDSPAVFVYSPAFIYVTANHVKGISIGHLIVPSERFLGVYKWYAETEKIWKIFSKFK